jgi:hypothetical protein
MAKKDFRAEKREQDAVNLGFRGELVSEALRVLEPPVVSRHDPLRRKVRHSQRHLGHIIIPFSEPQAVVERVLPQVITITEDLIAVGLPRQSFYFGWVEHPQNPGTHVHGGMFLGLLPNGDTYRLNLSRKLRTVTCRLACHKLGLTDPLSPDHYPLAMACWASWKQENELRVREAIDTIHTLHTTKQKLGQKLDHQDFLEMLITLGFRVLASPGKNGKPVLRESADDQLQIPLYNQVVTTLSPENNWICFRGPICHLDFDSQRWEQKAVARQREIDFLKNYSTRVFERDFLPLLSARMQLQKSYRIGARGPCVDLAAFECLRGAPEFNWVDADQLSPLGPETYQLDTKFSGLPDPMRYGPDLYYPYAIDEDPGVLNFIDPGWSDQDSGESRDDLRDQVPLMSGNWLSRAIPPPSDPAPGRPLNLLNVPSSTPTAARVAAGVIPAPAHIIEANKRRRRQVLFELIQEQCIAHEESLQQETKTLRDAGLPQLKSPPQNLNGISTTPKTERPVPASEKLPDPKPVSANSDGMSL